MIFKFVAHLAVLLVILHLNGSLISISSQKVLYVTVKTVFCLQVYSRKMKKKFFIAPPLKIRFLVPVERVETTILNPLHSYSQSDSQKSCYEK